MHGLIEPFYEACSPEIAAGHVWCDQPVYLPARHGLSITRIDPHDDRNLDYRICGRTAEIFNHAPVHSFAMESTEGAVVTKAKRDRPVIVLAAQTASEFRPNAAAATLADVVMVVPVYSALSDARLTRRMQMYEFSNAFYLPADTGLRFREGFARLDHIQPLSAAHLSKHRGMKLSVEALEVLHEWLWSFLTDTTSPDSLIADYRRSMIDDESDA